jgi:hypothetical protein
MDAPKCKSCGERHWERVCPKFALSEKSSRGGGESRPTEALGGIGDRNPAHPKLRANVAYGKRQGPASSTAQSEVASGPREAKKKRAPAGTFDRKAYQRELMRKRRLAEKAKAE